MQHDSQTRSASGPRRALLQHLALMPWLRLPWVPTDASTTATDGVPSCRPALRGECPVPRIVDREPRCRTKGKDRPAVYPDARAADAPPSIAPSAGRPESSGDTREGKAWVRRV